MTEEAKDITQDDTQNNFIVAKVKEVATLKKEYKPEQVTFIKNLVNPDLSDNELFMFMNFANNLQLNPFTGEIIAIAYGQGRDRRVNTITTRNGKRVIATRTGELDNIITEPIYIKQAQLFQDGKKLEGQFENKRVKPWEGGTLWGAKSTVVRKGKEFTVTVPFKEYNTGKNVWINKPETMIKKVAESQALSLAFPEILGGVYDEVEVNVIEDDQESEMASTIGDALKARKMEKLQPPVQAEDVKPRGNLQDAIDKANNYKSQSDEVVTAED